MIVLNVLGLESPTKKAIYEEFNAKSEKMTSMVDFIMTKLSLVGLTNKIHSCITF